MINGTNTIISEKSQINIIDIIFYKDYKYNIIDYKFTIPLYSESLQEFIKKNIKQYKKKIDSYKKILSKTIIKNSSKINIYLYFPLIPILIKL